MKLLRYLVFVSFLLTSSASVLHAQANSTLQQADDFADRYHWEKALPLYADAERRFAEAGDAATVAYCRIARIRASANGQSLDRIYDALNREINRAPFGSFPQLRLRALFFKADLETEIDPISVRAFDAKQRRRDWEEILSLAAQLGDPHFESRARGELGLVKLLEGDVAGADEIGSGLWQAKDSGDFLNEFRFRLAVSALFVAAGRHHDALGHLERAIDLAENHELPSFAAYYGKALVLLAEHGPEDAEPSVQQALIKAQFEDAPARAAQALFLKGRFIQEQGRTWEATEPLRVALKLTREMSYHRLISALSLELAKVYRSHRALWKALDTSEIGSASSLKAGDPIEPIAHLHVRAGIRADQGQLGEADRLYSDAIRSLDSLLVKFSSAHGRAFLVSKMSELYSDYFSLSLLRLKDPAKAFHAIEQARGRGISDALRGRWTEPTEHGDGADSRSPFEQSLAKLQTRLWFTEEPEALRGTMAEIFDLEQRLGPSRESGRHAVESKIFPPVPLSDVQTALYPDEVILEYVLKEPTSACLAITQKEAKGVLLSSKQVIEGLVKSYREEILQGRRASETARRLYDFLLAPIAGLDGKTRLTIVPDGILHLLPFDALIAPSGDYLLNTHLVDYSPSATLIWILRRLPPERTHTLRLLAIGDAPQFATDPPTGAASTGILPRLIRLPGSRAEVLAIAKALDNSSDVVTLLGREGTEAAVKSLALPNFDIIHFAVHGTSDAVFPGRSALLLGPGGGETEDGFLQAWEISRLRLNADLIVLSACDTAVGRVLEQEGVSNLVRSFLMAGARAVVASTWKAADRSIASLMTQFYTYLAQGVDKGSALRQAKLDFIQKFRDRSLPIDWAGMIMIGDSSEPIPLQPADEAEERKQ
jgi:CHAT domain-containing protein/tetratricopeptide (TPR) repeat protein